MANKPAVLPDVLRGRTPQGSRSERKLKDADNALRNELHRFLVDWLAEILVYDFQVNQTVTADTVGGRGVAPQP